MKLGIVGSRSVKIENLEKYIPENTTMIISGGAIGVDRCAEEYAKKNHIPILVIKPEYRIYGKGAPLMRNKLIVDEADEIYAFWDGESRGTKHTINYAIEVEKEVTIFKIKKT